MRIHSAIVAVLGVLALVAGYGLAIASGAASVIGYASGSERQQGFAGVKWFPLEFGLPLWLNAGTVVRADYDVKAEWGSLSLTVTPPLFLRTELQAATFYVPGHRKGSAYFVIQAPGWYRLGHDTSPIAGRLCPRRRSMAEVMVGSSDCPTYDVSYRVVWRLVDVGALGTGQPRLAVPRPNERLVTHTIGD